MSAHPAFGLSVCLSLSLSLSLSHTHTHTHTQTQSPALSLSGLRQRFRGASAPCVDRAVPCRARARTVRHVPGWHCRSARQPVKHQGSGGCRWVGMHGAPGWQMPPCSHRKCLEDGRRPGKVDIRLPGNREFKLPWHRDVLLQLHDVPQIRPKMLSARSKELKFLPLPPKSQPGIRNKS